MKTWLPLAIALAFIFRHQRRHGRPSFSAYAVAAYLVAVWLQVLPWALLP